MFGKSTPFSRSRSAARPFGGKRATNPFGKNANPKTVMSRTQTGSAPASKRASNPGGACCDSCAKGQGCSGSCSSKSTNPRADNVTSVTPGRVGATLAFNRSWNNWALPWGWNGWNGLGWAVPRPVPTCYLDGFGRLVCPTPVAARVAIAPRISFAAAPWWGGGGWGGWGGWGSPAASGALVL